MFHNWTQCCQTLLKIVSKCLYSFRKLSSLKLFHQCLQRLCNHLHLKLFERLNNLAVLQHINVYKRVPRITFELRCYKFLSIHYYIYKIIDYFDSLYLFWEFISKALLINSLYKIIFKMLTFLQHSSDSLKHNSKLLIKGREKK